MRQPFGLSFNLAQHIVGKKLAGQTKYPIVLMLEPLHTCNLVCLGCTPERYAGPMEEWRTVEDCLKAADDSGAPIVSICGGEPLVYKPIDRLVKELVARRRYCILCTNALLMDRFLPKIQTTPYVSFAVHIDGLEKTHDAVTQHPGCFKKAIHGIRLAKDRGFRVTTNTTVFAETQVDELVDLFRYLCEEERVDAVLVSPGYDFDQTGQDFFLKRRHTHELFKKLLSRCKPEWFGNSWLYRQFLQGEIGLTCTAWGNPTYTPEGWQSPCYMIRDKYYSTWNDLVTQTPWDKYGPESADPRCKNCMMHCGFEPTVATGRSVPVSWQIRNTLATILQ